MTQEFRIRTSSDTDLTGLNFGFIDDADGPTERYNPERYETRLFVADTESKSRVVETIEDELSDAEWATVEYRWTGSEYDDADYRDDPEYHLESHSLRTPPTIEYVEAFTARVEADYVIDGEKYSTDEEITAPESDGYSKTFEVVGTADGVALDADGVTLGHITTKDPLDRIPRSGIETVAYPESGPDRETVIEIGDEPPSRSTLERLREIEVATKETGPDAREIAPRIDELEDRVDELEGS